MTAPRFKDCMCGHTKLSHEVEDEPACVHENCGCRSYRPSAAAPPAPRPTAPLQSVPNPASLPRETPPESSKADQLVAAGKDSIDKRTVALAEKIAGQLEDLRQRLVDERERAVAEREVADLERRLAAAKAKLRKPPPSPSGTSAASSVCPDCGKGGFVKLGVHRALAHRAVGE